MTVRRKKLRIRARACIYEQDNEPAAAPATYIRLTGGMKSTNERAYN